MDSNRRRRHTLAVNSRRQQYRDYMQRLDGTAARRALAEGLCVEAPGRSIADRIVAKAELGLVAAQAVIGGIGSGKTTQLLLAEKRLDAIDGIKSLFVESLAQREDDHAQGGLLLCSLASELHRLQIDADTTAGAQIEKIKEYYRLHTAVGPQVRMSPIVMDSILQVAQIVHQGGFRTVLFDGLDRVAGNDHIGEVLQQEIPLFLKANISVVMVLPQRLMYGPQRALLNGFDEIYHQSPVDLEQGIEGRDFLCRVLRARADIAVLPEDSQDLLVQASGGVLRDLISLARSAGENAYVNGTGPVEPTHVDAAIDGFGRKKLINLSQQQIDTLQKVRTEGRFVQVNDQDLTLLLTGCILEYQKPNGAPRYAVHPTIKHLLAQIAGDA